MLHKQTAPALVLALMLPLASCERSALSPADQTADVDFLVTSRASPQNHCGEDPQFVAQDNCYESDPNPSAPGIWIDGWDPQHCWINPAIDQDQDGLDDFCENALFQTFRPQFVFKMDCNWDDGLNRMGGEYFFAARHISSDWVRIAYLPAYYWDCGVPEDTKCDVVDFFVAWEDICSHHSGDSEFVVIDVAYTASTAHWEVDAVFLSAHCYTANDDDCRWYDDGSFSYVNGNSRGVPIVWVAENKHANYPSQSACNYSLLFMDFESCEFNNTYQRFSMDKVINIGSRQAPMRDCGTIVSSSTIPDPSATECMWSQTAAQRFDGWMNENEGPGPKEYTHILGDLGF